MGVSPAPPGITSSGLKMDNKKRLAYAIIQFLHDQLRHGGLSSDTQESLEGGWAPATSRSLPGPWPAQSPSVDTWCVDAWSPTWLLGGGS